MPRRLAAQTAALLGAAPRLLIEVVHIAVLHGSAMTVLIPDPADPDNLAARLRAAPGLLMIADEEGSAGVIDAVGHEAILVTLGAQPAGASVWCAFDSARLAALDACGWRKSSPRGSPWRRLGERSPDYAPPKSMQVRLKLEYDGTNYSGWQMQSGQDSIQARLEEALARIFGAPIRVRGAAAPTPACTRADRSPRRGCRGRSIPPNSHALNAILPPDIVVLDASETSDNFDPRRDARLRIYEYRVLNQPLRSAFERNAAWLVREPLDIDAMNAAAAAFVGEHDFAAFRSLGSAEKTTVRRVELSRWRRDSESQKNEPDKDEP